MFREGKLSDCEQVYHLICQLENKRFEYRKFYDIYEAQVRNDQYHLFVHEQDEKISAILNLRIEEQLHHADLVAEIMEFIVDSDARSQGLGGKLYDYAVEYAKKRGCTQVEVTSNQVRVDAHRFYERQGMVKSSFKFVMPI